MAEEFREEKWFNTRSTASLPGEIPIDYARLEWFRRKLNWGHRFLGVGGVPRERWAVHLEKGLAEPALVVRARPVVVAVYTCEFDCVAMLRFAQGLPDGVTVREGDQLLSVNTFERARLGERKLSRDLVAGSEMRSHWSNVHPAIADFLSTDASAIAARKREIRDSDWARVAELVPAYRKRFPNRFRDGNPYISHLEAK